MFIGSITNWTSVVGTDIPFITELNSNNKISNTNGLIRLRTNGYWNVDARRDTILDASPDVSFVSGASPSIFKQVITGKTGWDLMISTICVPRYDVIKLA